MAMVDNRSAGKVGIIYERLLEKRIEIDVYVVDLDDSSDAGSGIIHPSVKFRAHRPENNYPALCVLNSSLYLFEGYDGMKRRWVPPPPIKTTTIYKSPYSLLDYDLIKRQQLHLLKNSHLLYLLEHSQQQKEDLLKLRSQEEEIDMEEEEWEKEEEDKERVDLMIIPPMNHPKGTPVALPTPDGKRILILATFFAAKESGEAFELYSPSEGFVSLPSLPVPHDHAAEPGYICSICTKFTDEWPREDEDTLYEPDIEEVLSYCFIGESRFLIEMDFAVYTIDVNDLGGGWATLAHDMFPLQDKALGFYRKYTGYFETFGDRYALMPAKNPTNYGKYKEDGVDEEAALYVHYIGSDGFFRKGPHEGFFFIEENPPKRLLLSSMNLPANPPDRWSLDRWETGLSILPGGRESVLQQNNKGGMEDTYVDEGMKDTYVVQHAQRMNEGRLVIDVCRTHFNTTNPGVVTSVISKSVSLTTLFSARPDVVTCFTL